MAALFNARNEVQAVSRRARLHHAGYPLRYVYRVTTGWFACLRRSREGGEAFTGLFMPGDVVGLTGLGGGDMHDELTALTDGAVQRLPLEAVRDAVGRDGATALDVAGLLAADSGYLREALVAIGTQSSQERLGTFLMQTYRRLVAAGLIAPDARQFELPLTQVQLGAVTGITSVHINRVLRTLRATGPFEFHGGVVRINTPLSDLRLEMQLAS